jgi:aldose 1-epimerase
MTGLGGRRYGAFAGLALETQGWPDAVNRSDFPSVILRPGETYLHRVRYRIAAV